MEAHTRRDRKLEKPRALLPELLHQPEGIWLDAASGDGVFAEALLEISGPSLRVIALDVKRSAVRSALDQLPNSTAAVYAVQANLCSPLPIAKVDGIILANGLHFYQETEQIGILTQCSHALKEAGQLIVVEYNTDFPTGAVPYPISREAIDSLLIRSGFEPAKKHKLVRSTYLGEMYAIMTTSISD
jgi:ubiquinone/menaquinone biosynthesis C-methylase UbiE